MVGIYDSDINTISYAKTCLLLSSPSIIATWVDTVEEHELPREHVQWPMGSGAEVLKLPGFTVRSNTVDLLVPESTLMPHKTALV